MKWPLVKLQELVDINIGRTPSRDNADYWGEGLPWLSIRDMNQGKILSKTAEQITALAVQDAKCKIAKKGTVLFSFKLSIGKVGIAHVDMFHNEAIAAMPIKQGVELCTEYLYFALMQMDSAKSTDRAVMGATLNKKKMAELKIPLPPLETQKKIAVVLEKADQLRKDCLQMEQELNNLAQSVFIDMFGDPVTNPRGWELTYLPNHGSFKNGLNFSKDDSGVRLKYLGVGDFKSLSSISKLDHLGFVDVNSLPADDYLLKNSDLVFVRSNGNKALVGRCISIYPDDVPVTFSGFCIRYRVESDSMEPEWLNYMLRTTSMKQAMLEGGQGANIQNINQKILSSLEIPLPPMDKQRLFCKAIESYRESLSQLKEYSQEINGLFNSLMQKAFKGELNL
ncbi:hypothetical protein BCV08_10730 [Vibrio breoganii]|uniref:restriction endonuclease subunit S n=1 Tax=Vibrio breoganii TaxID=553239 RepID=UPI000C847864|nr:restriction endonuclease subunit S [Vibrio breoganii]PMF95600.1 hypothetical protein BCV08_10730 [Vibrio breoganii]